MAKNILLPDLTPEQAQHAYSTLGHLIASMPDLLVNGPYPSETMTWLARANIQVEMVLGLTLDPIAFKSNSDQAISSDNRVPRAPAVQIIRAILYRALARAESLAPASVQGVFVNAGSAFDALTAIGKVLAKAKKDVLIVDPYMDEKALTDFAPLAAERVAINLLADIVSYKASLSPAAQRWKSQYGADRPLEVRLAPARQLHDRLLLIDASEVWILTQSLNAFAQRSPASVVRVDTETTALKIQAYTATWSNATVLV